MIIQDYLHRSIPKLANYLFFLGLAGLTANISPATATPPVSPASGKTSPAPTATPAVSPAPGKTSPAVPTPTEVNEYTLGGGDRVRVTVFQVADLSGDYLVLPDGTLTLPLVGGMNVEGKTVNQVSQLLTKRYATYLKRPIVTVSLLTPRPLQIAVAGEVNNPGTYTISFGQNPEQTLKAPLLTDLLRKAGGVTTVADVGQVQIRRTVNGQEQILQSNLWELIQKGDKKQDISLRDGDSIFIPTKTVVDAGETRQLADANFGIDSDRELNVTVVGEVYRPGAYRITPTTLNNTNPEAGGTKRQPARLTQALQQAGGIKPLANVRQIEVLRYNRDGSRQTIPVDLWALLETGDISSDVILQDGDTITVPTAPEISSKESETLAAASFSPAKIQVKVVGEVKQPGVLEVPPNTPLNQAILAAGNFDKRRADQSKVELIRLNPNGTVSQRSIPIDFSQGIDEAKNPTLRNNDVIVVGRNDLTSVTDTLGTIVSPIGSVLGVFNIFNLW